MVEGGKRGSSFPVNPSADFIARAKFSAYGGNAHGQNNLLSFLALLIREVSFTICADAGRRNGDYYVRA